MNTPSPSINIKDIIGQRPTVSETKDIRQARIDKLDKKPLLAIEDEPIDIPTFTADELKAYKDKTTETRQAETTNTELDESPELTRLKLQFRKTNWELGELLIKNNVKAPNGKDFYVNPNNKVLIRGSSKTLDKETLKDYILKAFNDDQLINF